jgi:hypothetical protein
MGRTVYMYVQYPSSSAVRADGLFVTLKVSKVVW